MPESDLTEILLLCRHDFSPVVPFDPACQKLARLDFTQNNTALTAGIVADTARLGCYVGAQLAGQNAVYGIGGYAEHRTIYSRSRLFDGESGEEEPRRLHLGTDIWGAAGTPVMAPLDGTVHSFAYNGQPGDYGTTIILRHVLAEHVFYTLYGHLGLVSIRGLQEGAVIGKGQVFAWLGEPAENGQWPPHLHFQIVRDMQGWRGDYPGVCRFSEQKEYLGNCPDPDLVLQLNRYAGS
ncbi:MAG: peptidoglycan DD-metalloendopeptidase family protein [Chitinophagaceae bacterium]